MTNYWILANEAANQLGWFAETIYTQWAWETGHFKSVNLLNNNNIAGQTWYEGCGHPKGSARPAKEGGCYIKYENAAQGYVEFIKKNIRRYGNVAKQKTVEGQIQAIADAGWASDKHYAEGLKSLHHSNIRDGIYNLPRLATASKKEDPKAKPENHIVVKGDTVSRLAKKYGTTQANIKKWNKLNDDYLIKVGQKLRVK